MQWLPNCYYSFQCLPILSHVLIVLIALIYEDVLCFLWPLKVCMTFLLQLLSYLAQLHDDKHSLYFSGNENNCSSPDAVRKVRLQISKHMDLWLSECNGGKSYMWLLVCSPCIHPTCVLGVLTKFIFIHIYYIFRNKYGNICHPTICYIIIVLINNKRVW